MVRRFFSILLVSALALAAFVITSSLKPPCANSISCIKDLSGDFELGSSAGEFMGRKVDVPDYLAGRGTDKSVLGEADPSGKRIEVNLSNQTLYAYQNDQLVMSFPVSTGKWGRTPTGTFRIWIKLRYTRMSGGTPGTGSYYNLPNVPFTMFYSNNEHSKAEGYSLHGAYWHSNFGHPMSHGCVNISIPDAERLYNWANPVSTANTTYSSDDDPGTMVVIYGTSPKE